jgi:excisionase family DNA binding protein
LSQTDAAPKITRFTPPNHLPEYLTPAEAQGFLGVGRSKIYDLLNSGELEHRRFGRLIRIPRTALLEAGAR